ncbi:lysophospholipase [Paraconexibacter sp.]|uniref:alpha/beta hydrolase n=1 Tax=Paraconexibacter sp. TaxID=2949640 RepID=UPI0035663282
MSTTEIAIAGTRGTVHVHVWPNDDARYVLLLAHGYGEHAGRYDHVARALVAHGAAVYAPDHHGHGRSEGERALVENIEHAVSDLDQVADIAQAAYPGLPVVLLGHSMGGIIATRYAQQHRERLSALALSGPAIGGNPNFEQLLGMDPIPEIPIDPATLSRDPAVGEAYAADELVYHGPFKRETLMAMFRAIENIATDGTLGSLPVVWIHGDQDQLAPLDVTRQAIEKIRGEELEEHIYVGAQHEVLNEINKHEVIEAITSFVDRWLPDNDDDA